MTHAADVLAVFTAAVFSFGTSTADSLPASCGNVGAAGYPVPAIVLPTLNLNRGTVLTVTNSSDAVNGDTSKVSALVASPGADGISLREALMAVNNDPGTWNIRFVPALAGKTILITTAPWPVLATGNVTINGDIDGDGKPDITLASALGARGPSYPHFLFSISSSGNTLHALTLQDFFAPILIQPKAADRNTTFADNTVSNVVTDSGIGLIASPNGVLTNTKNRWVNTVIIGNTITGGKIGGGIAAFVQNTVGDRLEHTVVANNTIRIPSTGRPPSAQVVGINIGGTGFGAGSNDNQQTDTLIAYNTVAGWLGAGIRVSGGELGAQNNLVDGVRIIGNTIRMDSEGNSEGLTSAIVIANGDGGTDYLDPKFQSVTWADKNIVRNVRIEGNLIEGAIGFGIGAGGGCCGSRDNVTSDFSILGNTIRSTQPYGNGIALTGGGSADLLARTTTGNQVSRVAIRWNTMEFPDRGMMGAQATNGGITITGGVRNVGKPEIASEVSNNSAQDIEISNNDIRTSNAGIAIVGGHGQAQLAGGNFVSKAAIACNVVSGSHLEPWYPGGKGINIVGGQGSARGNRAEQIRVENNLVNGVLDDFAVFANLVDLALPANLGGASDNTVAFAQLSGPGNAPYYTAGSAVNAASFRGPLAPGSIGTLFGANLGTRQAVAAAWPLDLGGTGIRLNGIAAPLYFVSAGQISFQAPWELAGKTQAELAVSVNNVTGPPLTVAVAASNPGLFATNTQGQGAVVNLQGRLVDASAPARAGDALEIFATGLGPVTNPPATGAAAPGGPFSTTPVLPSVTIGGRPAPVLFSGLAPGFVGLYQVNVQVPEGVAPGDAAPVQLSAVGAASNSVTIAVR